MSEFRYQRIADEIRDRILAGALIPGDRLPTQEAISQSHGVSRAVARKVLDVLEAEGLIDRVQGGRASVRPPAARRRPARYGGRTDTALAVVLDCADLDRAAAFWCAVLGYVALSKEPGSGPYRVLLPADGEGIELLLQQVPEAKVAKNRMHLDLRVVGLEAEVARLEALGARRVTDTPLSNNGGSGMCCWTRTATSSACCARRSGTATASGGRPRIRGSMPAANEPPMAYLADARSTWTDGFPDRRRFAR